jgi:CheY-like chemotaxis protein
MKTVAVVEDNADNRLLIQVLLGDLYRVECYENGPDALEAMARSKPDVLLLDISLPKMDGNEVLRLIREDPSLRDLPVIALTAHAMAGDRQKYLDVGFDEYVSKPIVEEEVLLSTIRRALGG